MQRLLILAMVSTLATLPTLAQGQYQGPPPVAPAIHSAPSQQGYAQQAAPYQNSAAPQYYPQAQYQQAAGQADPSVPGNSSLSPGEYVMTNRTTGQNMYVTVTATGQMYTQDAPPSAAVSQAVAAAPVLTAGAAANDPQAGATAATSQQQAASSKLNVVGSALKGALGMYYQYKYGSSGSYPMYGGYGGYGGYGYPAYGGYAPSTGGGGFLSNVLSRF